MELRRLHLDAHRCKGPLDDSARLATAMSQGIDACGATLRNQIVEQFTPHGVTVVAILAESHYVVSTWPELHFASVDVSVCGLADLALLTGPVTKLLQPDNVSEHCRSSTVIASPHSP